VETWAFGCWAEGWRGPRPRPAPGRWGPPCLPLRRLCLASPPPPRCHGPLGWWSAVEDQLHRFFTSSNGGGGGSGGPRLDALVVDAEGADANIITDYLEGGGAPPGVLVYERAHLRSKAAKTLAALLLRRGMSRFDGSAMRHAMRHARSPPGYSAAGWRTLVKVLEKVPARANALWVSADLGNASAACHLPPCYERGAASAACSSSRGSRACGQKDDS